MLWVVYLNRAVCHPRLGRVGSLPVRAGASGQKLGHMLDCILLLLQPQTAEEATAALAVKLCLGLLWADIALPVDMPFLSDDPYDWKNRSRSLRPRFPNKVSLTPQPGGAVSYCCAVWARACELLWVDRVRTHRSVGLRRLSNNLVTRRSLVDHRRHNLALTRFSVCMQALGEQHRTRCLALLVCWRPTWLRRPANLLPTADSVHRLPSAGQSGWVDESGMSLGLRTDGLRASLCLSYTQIIGLATDL
jgi:hypothetical protein